VRMVRGVAPDAGYLRATDRELVAAQPEIARECFQFSGRGHYAGTLITARGPASLPAQSEKAHRPTGARLAIGGTETEIRWNGSPSRPEGWNNPVEGFRLDAIDGTLQQASAYHWHVSDPVLFASSIGATLEPIGGAITSPCHLAVFWYSERP